MNRKLWRARSVVVLVAALATSSTLGLAARTQSAAVPTEADAVRLEGKIGAIAAADIGSRTARETVEVSEVELESYVLYRMGEQLPVRVDGLDLELRPGRMMATVDMFVDADLASSQPLVGPLFEGAHSVFFEGDFEARNGRGMFSLQGVRVDGIAVPVFLVKALLGSIEDPVDLDAPFDTPLGIDDVVLLDRTARVTY